MKTDTQPNFIIIFTILSPFFFKKNFSTFLILLFVIFILLIYTSFNFSLGALRSWAGYLTPLMMLMFVKSISADYGVLFRVQKWIDTAFWIWILFGIAQFLTNSELLNLTYRGSRSSDRGWYSFSGEPSAFATVLFLFAAFYLARRRLVLTLIAFLTTIIVAKSLIGLVYFLILFSLHSIVSFRVLSIYIVIFTGIFLTYFFFTPAYILELFPETSRIRNLIEIMIHSPAEFIEDASFVSRFKDLSSVYDWLIEGKIFGNGLDTNQLIKSGWGVLMYQTGLIGFIYSVCFVIFILYKACKVDRRAFLSAASIIVIVFSATPTAMPIWSFFVLHLIYVSSARTKVGHRQSIR